MILIQSIKKIKRLLSRKWFKEILVDSIFYLLFFILGLSFVYSKIDKRGEKVLILESSKEEILKQVQDDNGIFQKNNKNIQGETKYVSSSRGKYFYEVGSSRANSLSDKYKVYFSTPEEAKKAGFKPYFGN